MPMFVPAGIVGKVVGNSGWIDGSGLNAPASIVVYGIVSGDTLDVRVSNALQQPDVSDIGVIYGASISTDGVVKITEPYRWYMIRRTAITGGGLVSALLFGLRPPGTA